MLDTWIIPESGRKGRPGYGPPGRPADEPGAGEQEAPGRLGAARDPDAPVAHHIGRPRARLEAERRLPEGRSVQRAGDAERLGQAAGTGAEQPRLPGTPARLHGGE